MLTSCYAMWMGWGPELIFFYNDAYAQQTLGEKHPWALGQPARQVWAEIWGVLEPRIRHVLETGEATWDEGLLLFLERNGYPEETYHTFSYSPAPGDAAGEIAGLFCVVIEETERVIPSGVSRCCWIWRRVWRERRLQKRSSARWSNASPRARATFHFRSATSSNRTPRRRGACHKRHSV